MSVIEHVLVRKKPSRFSGSDYLLDTMLASAGSLLITGLIAIFQWYPRIPNISIVYLLVVLALATTRGQYAAILAALVAFLSFNFFLVPPFYTFVIYRVEEWIALFVFLMTALLTGQLAVALQNRAEQASRREQETHILYDLVRVTHREEEPESQFKAIASAVQKVLAPMGVQGCALLQPNSVGLFQMQASTLPSAHRAEWASLSLEGQEAAAWVCASGRPLTIYEAPEKVRKETKGNGSAPLPDERFGEALHGRSVCLLPLAAGSKGSGVLQLHLPGQTTRAFLHDTEGKKAPSLSLSGHSRFFWTFLNQVATLVERARLHQDMVRMAVLERTDALRAALLSSVSHDLRTPLTAIKAAASSLLQRGVQWDEEARQGFAQSIVREADRLNRLVGNLLDMSRIEEGALKPERESYSLAALIQDVLARLDPLFAGRRVELHLPDDLLLVEMDYLQMDQVLTNLLENALHHTPAGTPIEVSALLRGDEVLMRVSDCGPGLPPSELERIFDKFYRVLHAEQRSSGFSAGSGLGLSVCRGLVEAHDGRIWAELRDGGGLIVSVVLPTAITGEGEHQQ